MGAPFEVEQLLRATLKPALGCTEPVAVAYAVAAAVQAPMGWLPVRPTPLRVTLIRRISTVFTSP